MQTHLQLLVEVAAEAAEAVAEAEADTPEDTTGKVRRTDTGSKMDPNPRREKKENRHHLSQYTSRATRLHKDTSVDPATTAGTTDISRQNAEENRRKSTYSTGRNLDPGALEGTTNHHHLDLERESKWII